MAARVMVAGTSPHRPLLSSSSSNSLASPAINSRPAVILPVEFSSAHFSPSPSPYQYLLYIRLCCFPFLPSFGIMTLFSRKQGLGNNSNDYIGLACSLKDVYGIPSVTVPVSRLDWLRNAAGLLDSNYWKGTLRPRPILDWYLERVEDAVNEAKRLSKDGSLSLIGHSAGGWLARVYMEDFGKSGISLLLTLGTPHLPPPKGVPGVIDQTRGLLDYVETYCSKAVYAPQLKYVCISSRYIQGARFFEKSLSNPATLVSTDNFQQIIVSRDISGLPAFFTNIRACFVGLGYKQVCGQADGWGDGVVPEMSAHLEGARNITLVGVYHSPVGSDDITRPWYGSPAPLDKWVHHLQG